MQNIDVNLKHFCLSDSQNWKLGIVKCRKQSVFLEGFTCGRRQSCEEERASDLTLTLIEKPTWSHGRCCGKGQAWECLRRHVDSQGQKIMVVLGKDRIGCRTEVPQRFQHLWLLSLWVGLAWCLAHTRRPASKHIVSSVMVIPVVLGTVLDCAGRQETLFKEKAWVHLKSIPLCLPCVCLYTCVCWHTLMCAAASGAARVLPIS